MSLFLNESCEALRGARWLGVVQRKVTRQRAPPLDVFEGPPSVSVQSDSERPLLQRADLDVTDPDLLLLRIKTNEW